MFPFSNLTRRLAAVLLLCAALLPMREALAQTSPVFSRSLTLLSTLAYDANGSAAFSAGGVVTVESQRVTDPVAGDALLLTVILANFPIRHIATGTVYTVNHRESVIKPFASQVPTELTLPMVWQSGGTDTRPRTAVAKWDFLVSLDGSVMSWWPASIRVSN